MPPKTRINIVLLAGGSGKRLYPLSNNFHPKQFISLPQLGISSFQLTLKRSLKITSPNNIIITSNSNYHNLIKQQITELELKTDDFQIILEKHNLNTGIAIYDACCFIMNQINDNLTYFFPTDQIISEDPDFFLNILSQIDPDKINLFGQYTEEACHNFGYIVKGDMLSDKYYQLAEFIEKPNITQLNYLKPLNVYRNLGIYLARPSILYQEFNKLSNLTNSLNLSIDKIIAEHSKLLNFKSIDFEWHDIGSIASLHQYCGENILNNCSIDLIDILKFNEESKEFRLNYHNQQLQILKKI